jgi:hypothetical protein
MYYLEKTKLDIIPITDFIKNNYKNHRLFITHCHPCSYIFIYITNEILKIYKNIFSVNVNYYKDIFNYPFNEGVHSENWVDSKYSIIELNLTFIKNTDDLTTKKYITEIYMNV